MDSREMMALPLKERNKLFNGMTVAERAVLVAQDVLAQIAAEVYNPNAGSYLNLVSAPTEAENYQQLLSEVTSCTVCAIGAAFVSCVRLGNSAEPTSGITDMGRSMVQVIGRAFTRREVRAMEYMLEDGDYSMYDQHNGTYNDKKSAFTSIEKTGLHKYRNELIPNYERPDRAQNKELLVLLMQNVIDNGGALTVPGIDLKHEE